MYKLAIIQIKFSYVFAIVFLMTITSCRKSEDIAESKITEKPMTSAYNPSQPNQLAAGLSFTLVSNTMIRNTAAWNGFTDLHGYAGKLYCVYREGATHISPDGKIRVIRYNTTTFQWEGIKLISYTPPAPYTLGDLRDPKLSTNPDGKLMLTVAATLYEGSVKKGTQSMAYFTEDGVNWGTPYIIGIINSGWRWRTEWFNGIGYNIRYSNGIQLYKSNADGTAFPTQLWSQFAGNADVNETGFCFNTGDNDKMYVLARFDGTTNNSRVGVSSPPYTSITWASAYTGIRIGGPDLFRMENGAIIAGIRRYSGSSQYPALYAVHTNPTGGMTELVRFVQGNAGDCGYPGIWKFGNQIWVTYYSSHSGKACIYLAKLNYTL
jgi:hypothetical protein